MNMMRAELRIETPNARTVYGSLLPEIGREIPRTSSEAELGDGEMLLRIESEDLSSLRAALNSYLSWIRISEEVIRLTGERDE